MIIMKFGGTSVATCEAIRRDIAIVKGKLQQKPVVVVSALSKVTDLLYQIADSIAAGDIDCANEQIDRLRKRHIALADELMGSSQHGIQAKTEVNELCSSLQRLAGAACVLGELTARSKARILANGELLSSAIIANAMNHDGIATALVDAREMIITDDDYLQGHPLTAEIERRVPAVIDRAYTHRQAVITQGFVGSTMGGETTVLGRGGSDYTASLIGMAVNAQAIEIWTDVDGIRTADPKRVANTRNIDRLSFEEAAEMAHFGAKVLHPLTIEPAVSKSIPVFVLNSTNPLNKGTQILPSPQIEEGIKALSFKENITMLNIFSARMIDVSGFLSRVFNIFAAHNVSVDLISTSEANISMTIDSGQDIDAVVDELSQFAQVKVHRDKSQVSIIGKDATYQRGLLRWAMTAISNIDVYMISQGTSMVNISYVINRADLDDVLQDLHRYLFEY